MISAGMKHKIPTWGIDPDGKAIVRRRAEMWRRLRGKRVLCRLCYRLCELGGGEMGWCRYRENRRGKMSLIAHGVVSCAVRQQRGYQVDPFLTFKPGALSLFLGSTYCTAGCVFCMSTQITWRPERVSWGVCGERGPGMDGGWYGYRAMLHPEGAVDLARRWGCSQILLGINEPTLSFEYTYDVARLAKRAGLNVLIETNGFNTPEVVHKLAPFVDAVDLGIKGSGEPAFYDKWMQSAGAMSHVLDSGREWKRAGIHHVAGDVIAPPQMQTDAEAEEAQRRLYGWIAEELGPQTLLLITPMIVPGPQGKALPWDGFLLSARATVTDYEGYYARQYRALEITREAGLLYAHRKTDDEVIRCRNCAGVLLRFRSPMLHCTPCTMATHFCPFWDHEQHVTDGCCDHCGAGVPIVTLSEAELSVIREQVRRRSAEAQAIRRPMT